MLLQLNRIIKKDKIYFLLSRTVTTTTNNIETVDLAYSSYGFASTKPPLLTLHGLTGSKNNWKGISEVIHKTTGIQVIDVDARNHGNSPHSPQHTYIHMAQDVVKLVKKLEIPKVSLIGHSMGGRTAMVLSLLFPDLISSILIIDILPLKIDPTIFTMASLFDAMSGVSFRPGITMSEAKELADEQIKAVTHDENIRRYLLENVVQTDTGSYTWTLNVPILKESFHTTMLEFPSSLKGCQYTGPALFIAGSLSNFINKSDMPEILEYFPQGELTVIRGGGHWVHYQQTEKFLEVVCKFLTEKS